MVLTNKGDYHECNILLYVENLGAKVSGVLEYDEYDRATKNRSEIKTI